MRVALLAVGVCCGCAGITKQSVLGHPMRQRINLVVRTSTEVNKTDDAGGVGTLVDTVLAGLREHGIESDIYAAPDEHPHAPRIELQVLYWSQRSTLSHDLEAAGWVVPIVSLGALGSNNAMVVVCRVFLADGAPSVFKERFSASSIADDPTGVAETVGEEIVDEVLR
ncbi:MAG TPA: hypothetical protein VHW01_12195 [Polyangiaceae bacterium]|jgi:hypothetical protein|nr:hypothetical protein [Polyangiaceae bacterium]